MVTNFEDEDYDLGYCEGDPKLEDINPKDLTRLAKLQQAIVLHPRENHQDLASVGLLAEMYGDDLEVW